jgi:hypothetical protein
MILFLQFFKVLSSLNVKKADVIFYRLPKKIRKSLLPGAVQFSRILPRSPSPRRGEGFRAFDCGGEPDGPALLPMFFITEDIKKRLIHFPELKVKKNF